jgi:RimJ/RimL family protein N-acetyltransferase
MTEPLLRPWRASDASALQHAHRSAPDLIKQLGDIDLSTGVLAEEFIERLLPFDESRRNWAIVDDNLAVGNVGVTAIDLTHGTAWVYYWFSETARGRGLASRALISLSEWAFDTGLFRLELGHPDPCPERRRAPDTCRPDRRPPQRTHQHPGTLSLASP